MLKKTFKVFVNNPEVPKSAVDILRKHCNVIVCESIPPIRSEILEKCRDVDAILWGDNEPLNVDVLNAAGERLKAISAMTAGVDHVDVAEVKKRGIPLGHTPGVVSEVVAELAIGLMIAAGRRFHEGRDKIETSNWLTDRKMWMLGADFRDCTVGFLGFGGIGQAIAKRLQGFNVGKIIYNTRQKISNESEYLASHASLESVLKESDVLFVACPLNKSTAGLLNTEAFNKMKSNCVLINIARGGIIDQNALHLALKQNKIFAAGLDVMDPEPLPFDDPLLSLPNCVIIPHVGTSTIMATKAMANLAVQNIINALGGKPMVASVY